ncbi:DUF262 domain-containing protein [Chryseobacterium sp. GP-SGM7]|uniref:DUF262 domain-containing protein n=1 Tax=Chryseobacterium sp. GP-SGM7 TaxID=3411323 RepID=UPI003B958DAB
MSNHLDTEKGDIEEEIGNEEIDVLTPFDPKKINIKVIPLTIGQLVDKLEYKEINIPEYQRKAGLWDEKRKSRFIESLMLKLPIPLFYFDEREQDIWWVVDGLQRVTTMREFIIEKKFKLSKLEFLRELEGCGWDELERIYQRNINQSQITINLIQKGTPEKVKHNIFRRINQGSIELSSQELRTALLWGYKTEFLKSLVRGTGKEAKKFIEVTGGKVKTDRQEDLDFASRFVGFFLQGYENYEPDMDNFLTEGTLLIPESKLNQIKIKDAFYQGLDTAFTIFGNDAFRKRLNKDDARKQLNKSIFEILSVSFAQLEPKESKKLIKSKDRFIAEFILLQNDKKFLDSISNGTSGKDRTLLRNKEARKLIEKFKK